jgi:hypothetical protein
MRPLKYHVVRNNRVPFKHLILADEGTVEWDLPNLEHHELISRYGFGNLALVENKSSNIVKEYSIKITLPDGTFTVVQVTVTIFLMLAFITIQRYRDTCLLYCR